LKAKLARAAVAALLVLVMAVTPLSAFLSGGGLEVRLPGSGTGFGHNPSVRVVMQDETGFVRAIAGASPGALNVVKNPNGNPMALVVTWLGGCADRVAYLTFVRTGDRFLLTQRTDEFGCGLLIGYDRSVVIGLWSPINSANVDFDPMLPR
jgi:hypothetical protein